MSGPDVRDVPSADFGEAARPPREPGESVRLLAAVRHAARRVSGPGDFQQLLREVLETLMEAAQATGGTIYLHDRESRRLVFRHVLPDEVALRMPFRDIPDDFGVAGKVFTTRKAEISAFPEGGDPNRRELAEKTGVPIRTMITVPLMLEDGDPIGVVQLVNKREGQFDERDVMLLDTVSAICTMAFLNSQMREQHARAMQLLGMGKLAHDIKNLAYALRASVGFVSPSLLALRRRFEGAGLGEDALAELTAVEESFSDLQASIVRLERYSKLISDLSVGRTPQPRLTLAPLAPTIRESAAFLEPEARQNRLEIVYDLQEEAPPLPHDEMYVGRIVQNLLSNAIKAAASAVTAEWLRENANREDAVFDRVIVRYYTLDRRHVLEIEDHGPGMSRELVRALESGQGTSLWLDRSGWGMKIVFELVRSLGGQLALHSEPGVGTLARVTLFEVSPAGARE